MPVFYAAWTKMGFGFVVTNSIAAITPITNYAREELFREKNL